MISLTRDVSGKGGLVQTSIHDILFLECDAKMKRVLFHLQDETLYAAGTLVYWIEAINGTGYHFLECDRNTAVNMEKIKVLDSVYKRAYFEDEVSESSKYCNMSWAKFKSIQQQLKRDYGLEFA